MALGPFISFPFTFRYASNTVLRVIDLERDETNISAPRMEYVKGMPGFVPRPEVVRISPAWETILSQRAISSGSIRGAACCPFGIVCFLMNIFWRVKGG